MLLTLASPFPWHPDDMLTSTPWKKIVAKLQRDFYITLKLVPVSIKLLKTDHHAMWFLLINLTN